MRGNRQEGEFELVLDRWASAVPKADVSAETRTRIRNALSASLVPVKPIPSVNGLALILFLVFAIVAGVLITIGDKADVHFLTGSQLLAIAAILVAGGVLFSIVLAWRMVPGSRRWFSTPAALLLWMIGVAGGFVLLFPWRSSIGFVAEGWPCARMELMIAIPSAALFWLIARQGALFRDAALGATVVGLACSLALLVVQFPCRFPNMPHLLVWHGLVAAALISLGALIGSLRHPREHDERD